MANNANKIIVGANGTVFVGPTTATAPTDATSGLSGFTELGFVAETGVTITPSQTVTDIMAWQSLYTVRKIITARGLELTFTLREFNLESIPFAFGGGAMHDSGGVVKYTPPAAGAIDNRSLVVDWQDGNNHFRLYVPTGMVTDLSGFTVSRTAPAELPVKFGLNYSGSGDVWALFSDDSGLYS
jgi:hypothetical protein